MLGIKGSTLITIKQSFFWCIFIGATENLPIMSPQVSKFYRNVISVKQKWNKQVAITMELLHYSKNINKCIESAIF